MWGGGVNRDFSDNWKVFFPEKFENGMNNDAELQMLISRIRLCKSMDYQNIQIGIDSKLIVNWLEKNIAVLGTFGCFGRT